MNNFHLYAVRLMALALLAIAAVMGVSPAARAASPESIEISFDLAPVAPAPAKVTEAPKPTAPAPAEASSVKPLQIPTQATRIPVGVADSAKAISELPPPPPEVYETVRSLAPAPSKPAPSAPATPAPVSPESAQPAPVLSESIQSASAHAESVEPEPIQFETPPVAAAAPPAPKPAQAPVAQASPPPQPSPQAAPEPAALSFDLNPTARLIPPTAQTQAALTGQGGEATPAPLSPSHSPTPLNTLFDQGTNSIVAKAVGSAEGTRTPDGGKTWAYQGHVDPGNGVWNLGTFSYQHGATSPAEADQKQLERLKGQAQTLRRAALERGLTLTLEEELNGIDLANQSPRAALSRGGYMDRLKEAHDVGLSGADAVLWARTRSFLDPDTNRWNAPGLGNTAHGVTSDQDRRMKAIARAIEAQQRTANTPLSVSADQQAMRQPLPAVSPVPQSQVVANQLPQAEQEAQMEKTANDIISLDLAPM
jgi:hypothetical protein